MCYQYRLAKIVRNWYTMSGWIGQHRSGAFNSQSKGNLIYYFYELWSVVLLKEIHATIHWLSYREGGRKRPLDVGVRYAPTIVLADDETRSHWSVIFIVQPSEKDGTSKITFQLLVDNSATHQVQEKLVAGTHFSLHEGERIVAIGHITNSDY